jgi:hypothetical protein
VDFGLREGRNFLFQFVVNFKGALFSGRNSSIPIWLDIARRIALSVGFSGTKPSYYHDNNTGIIYEGFATVRKDNGGISMNKERRPRPCMVILYLLDAVLDT